MPSFFLHIGTHKTGSTAIQNYLFKNRKKLEEANFYYPDIGLHNTGHHNIAWAASRGESQNLQQFIDAINAYCAESGVEHVILSSEVFEYLPDPRSVLQMLPSNTKIILFLRRPDKYLESGYNQHVRSYNLRFSGDIFRFYYRMNFAHRRKYVDLCNRWASVVGIDHIKIFSYDKARQTNSLFQVFHDAIGLDCRSDLERPSKSEQNIGIYAPAIYYLSRLNNVPLTKTKHIQLTKTISEHFSGHPKQNMLPKSDRTTLYQNAQGDIRALEEQYGIQLFTPPDSDIDSELDFCDYATLDHSLLNFLLARVC